MAQVNQSPIEVVLRKNKNSKSLAFGKYYLESRTAKVLSTRGLLEHIMSHGLNIPRSVMQGVLLQLIECLTELVMKGQPVKLDGFGTLKLSAESEGVARPDDFKFNWDNNSRGDLKGLHLLLIPDNTELDKLTSKANLAKANVDLTGVVESVELQDGKKTTAFTDLDVFKYEKNNPTPPEP